MAKKVLTSREFNQNASEAKRAADSGPVFITDRGRPGHVLLSFDDYAKLASGEVSLAQALGQAGGVEVEFEPVRLGDVHRLPDLG